MVFAIRPAKVVNFCKNPKKNAIKMHQMCRKTVLTYFYAHLMSA